MLTSVTVALVWMASHLPFIMGYVLAAACMSIMVLAHDTSDSDPHALSHEYEAISESHIVPGVRWMYCGGLSVALISMGRLYRISTSDASNSTLVGIISLSHSYRQVPNERLGKSWRLALRAAVATVILLLPLTDDHIMNSLNLIATTCGLVVLTLIGELLGSTCATEKNFFQRDRRCTYTAQCNANRKDLEEHVKSGEVLNIEELADREKKRNFFDTTL